MPIVVDDQGKLWGLQCQICERQIRWTGGTKIAHAGWVATPDCDYRCPDCIATERALRQLDREIRRRRQ